MAKRGIIAIMAVLLLVPSVMAAGDIHIAANNDKVKQGQWVSFFTNVDIETNEEYKVEKMTFRLGNWYDRYWPSSKWAWRQDCMFEADGTIISGCENVKSIKVIKGEDTGEYGYHYKSKSMWVKITYDTKDLKPGSYYAKQFALIKTKTDSKWFSSSAEWFKIVAWKNWHRPHKHR